MYRKRTLEKRIVGAIAAFPEEFLPETVALPHPKGQLLPLVIRLANLPEKPILRLELEKVDGLGWRLLFSVYLTHWYDWKASGGVLARFGPPEQFHYRISEDWMLFAESWRPCPVCPDEIVMTIRDFVRQLQHALTLH